MKIKNFEQNFTIGFVIMMLCAGISILTNDDIYINVDSEVQAVFPSEATLSDFIDIDGDTAMDSFQPKTGSGTIESPYIIKNLEIKINKTTSTHTAITLQSVTRYVILQNLTLIGYVNSESDYAETGIYLYGSAHITIQFCNISLFNDGIYTNDVNDTHISNNTITSCVEAAIYASPSYNSSFTNNFIMNNQGSGFYLNGEHNCVENNLISGTTDGDGLFIYITTNCTVIKNQITNNSDNGIFIESTNTDNFILNNLIEANNRSGVYSSNAHNVTLNGNTIRNNLRNGIESHNSENHTYYANHIENNQLYGISLETTNKSLIYFNALIGNGINQAICNNTSENHWDNGTWGNYWSDYLTRYPSATNNGVVWNTNYTIDTGCNDTKPLLKNPFLVGDLQVSLYYNGGLEKIMPPIVNNVKLNSSLILTNQTSGNWTISGLNYGDYNLTYQINGTDYSMLIQIRDKMTYIVIIANYNSSVSGSENTTTTTPSDPSTPPPPPSGNNDWIYTLVFGGIGVVLLGLGYKITKKKRI